MALAIVMKNLAERPGFSFEKPVFDLRHGGVK
jgi:hypothetical protein